MLKTLLLIDMSQRLKGIHLNFINIQCSINCRYGHCELYAGNCTVCNVVFMEGLDHVFITAVHGSQNTISSILDDMIPPFLKRNADVDGDNCYENILRVICNYYMSPCVNDSFQLVPTSICPDDCSTVERDCPTGWRVAQYSLEDYQFLRCNHTLEFIHPLPSCCLGLQVIGEHGY